MARAASRAHSRCDGLREPKVRPGGEGVEVRGGQATVLSSENTGNSLS